MNELSSDRTPTPTSPPPQVGSAHAETKHYVEQANPCWDETLELPLDPAKLAAAYRGPLFIGQGTTDLQVKMTDAEALSAARPDATLVPFEGVNHVLKVAPADPELVSWWRYCSMSESTVWLCCTAKME